MVDNTKTAVELNDGVLEQTDGGVQIDHNHMTAGIVINNDH